MGKLEMGLRASGHFWNIMTMYAMTIIMRASFYVSIAVIGSKLEPLELAVVFGAYPLTELVSVSFFGSYSDKIGRKPIFVASLFMTSLAASCFPYPPTCGSCLFSLSCLALVQPP